MFITEAEAKSKKCIFLSQAALSNPRITETSGRMPRNAWDSCHCLGSECVSGWRWSNEDKKEQKGYCGFGCKPEL